MSCPRNMVWENPSDSPESENHRVSGTGWAILLLESLSQLKFSFETGISKNTTHKALSTAYVPAGPTHSVSHPLTPFFVHLVIR